MTKPKDRDTKDCSGQFSRLKGVKDTAAYCGCSVSKLNKLRIFGGGPTFIKIGAKVVYDLADIDAWLVANRRASTSRAVR